MGITTAVVPRTGAAALMATVLALGAAAPAGATGPGPATGVWLDQDNNGPWLELTQRHGDALFGVLSLPATESRPETTLVAAGRLVDGYAELGLHRLSGGLGDSRLARWGRLDVVFGGCAAEAALYRAHGQAGGSGQSSDGQESGTGERTDGNGSSKSTDPADRGPGASTNGQESGSGKSTDDIDGGLGASTDAKGSASGKSTGDIDGGAGASTDAKGSGTGKSGTGGLIQWYPNPNVERVGSEAEFIGALRLVAAGCGDDVR